MINLSFAGCGFLGIYHVGVASCFREYAPHVLVSKIAGASVGSIAAAALICDVSLGQTTTDILGVAVKARSSTLGPLSPRFDLNKILRERLENALPVNAHQICSGRLFISVTRWKDRKNVLLSQFNIREELIQAILCSCFIPGYSGLALPIFQGEYYVDGGMSDNLPVLDDNTVTVSPFAGEHDICPQDESCNILQVNFGNTSIAVSPGNMFRLLRILFPPKPEILSKMCQQGFDDALKFLQRKNVISCTRCLGVRSVIKITKRSSENDVESGHSGLGHEFDSCKECKQKRQKANFGNLPDAVVNAIQDACDQVNKGIFNWLFRHRPMKILALMGLPYTIPLDISIVIFTKIWQKLPDFRKELMSKFDFVISLTKQLLSKLEERKIYRAIFQCELSITEFNYSEDNVTSSYVNPFHNVDPHETCKIKIEEERTPKRKFSIRRTSSIQAPPDVSRRQQRKSYAGFPNKGYQQEIELPARRKSFSEINQPERVIRNLKIGFSVGMASGISQNDKNSDLFQSLKSLGDADSELNIVELAKKAVGMEHEYIHQHYSKIKSQNDSSVNNVIDPTDSDPLMSYCYMDEDNTIKINEIYNVTDADTSLVLHDEERQINNKLQWESNWINPPEFQQTPNVSVVDTLDDHEFDTSDNEYDLTANNEVFTETRSNSISENNNNEERMNILKPPRKTSFVIVK